MLLKRSVRTPGPTWAAIDFYLASGYHRPAIHMSKHFESD
jgi:hypothetical protein